MYNCRHFPLVFEFFLLSFLSKHLPFVCSVFVVVVVIFSFLAIGYSMGILVPLPGVESVPPEVVVQRPNTRLPANSLIFHFLNGILFSTKF